MPENNLIRSGLGKWTGVGCGRRSLKCFIYSAVISHFKTSMFSETSSDSHFVHLSTASNFSPD